MNRLFDQENSSKLEEEFIKSTLAILDIEKDEKERDIEEVKRNINLRKDDMLDWYILKVIEKYFPNKQYDELQINEETVDYKNLKQFYNTLITEYDRNPKIGVKYRYNIDFVSIDKKEFFFGDSLFEALLKEEVDTVGGLLEKYIEELKRVEEKRKNLRKECRELPTGSIIKQLADIQNDKIENSAVQEVNDDPLKKYLIYNNLIGKNYYYYISPAGKNISASDVDFIIKVLSKEKFKDTVIDDVKGVLKELHTSKVNYQYAYSSDLARYLILSDEDDKGLGMKIIDSCVEKQDNEFVTNLLIKMEENTSELVEVLIGILQKDNNFIRLIFNDMVDRIAPYILITTVIKNIDCFDKALKREDVNSLLSTFLNSQLGFKIIGTELINDKIAIERYRNTIFIDWLNNMPMEFTSSLEISEVIFENGMYQPENSNFDFFNRVFHLNHSFTNFLNKIQDIDHIVIDKHGLYIYFADLIAYGSPDMKVNSYSELLDFIKYFWETVSSEELIEIYAKMKLPSPNYDANVRD
ncbi:hypothetical protein [Listeria fleischmannii]|uniref:hypothetical protein n=1 Tax=Listeria fleischmannii TaxID=1069827 RepID=UPI0004B9953E|nr:hypothetical protein [Listeria fleischmannii]